MAQFFLHTFKGMYLHACFMIEEYYFDSLSDLKIASFYRSETYLLVTLYQG